MHISVSISFGLEVAWKAEIFLFRDYALFSIRCGYDKLGPDGFTMITVFVCLKCDCCGDCVDTGKAEGYGWFKALKLRLQHMDNVQVKSVNCLGGCEYSVAEGQDNGCCSVGLVGQGKFGYVLNQLVPGEDDDKVVLLVERYLARKDGLLTPKGTDLTREVRRHIATRLPATPEE
jgi:predicted metal-binding protein